MFRSFINEQLKATVGPSFLLIGEDHENSSALIGLAHCVEQIKKSGKKVIVITEDLRRQTNLLGGEKAYSSKDAAKQLSEGQTDTDFDAIQTLINNHVTVYGLESKKTAPPLFFKGTTKKELFNEVKKEIPYILDDQVIKKWMADSVNDTSIDVQTFRDMINSQYGNATQRVVIVNQEIVSQMLLAAKKNPGNTLIIFTGGSAHLAQAMSLSGENNIVDPGVFARLKTMVGKQNVNCCFLNDKPVSSDKADYTPDPDAKLQYGSIPNHFTVPKKFTISGSPLDEKLKMIENKYKQQFFAKPQQQSNVQAVQDQQADVSSSKPGGLKS